MTVFNQVDNDCFHNRLCMLMHANWVSVAYEMHQQEHNNIISTQSWLCHAWFAILSTWSSGDHCTFCSKRHLAATIRQSDSLD